jgi:hypothetical protein
VDAARISTKGFSQKKEDKQEEGPLETDLSNHCEHGLWRRGLRPCPRAGRGAPRAERSPAARRRRRIRSVGRAAAGVVVVRARQREIKERRTDAPPYGALCPRPQRQSPAHGAVTARCGRPALKRKSPAPTGTCCQRTRQFSVNILISNITSNFIT